MEDKHPKFPDDEIVLDEPPLTRVSSGCTNPGYWDRKAHQWAHQEYLRRKRKENPPPTQMEFPNMRF